MQFSLVSNKEMLVFCALGSMMEGFAYRSAVSGIHAQDHKGHAGLRVPATVYLDYPDLDYLDFSIIWTLSLVPIWS